MQFVNKNCSPFDLNIGHGNKKINNTCTTKFLGLTLKNTLSWKTHIDTTVPKLSSATFAIRTVKPYLSQDSLKTIYYSYFHSIMTQGIILGKTHTIVILSSDCKKKKLLELLWNLEIETHVENTLRN